MLRRLAEQSASRSVAAKRFEEQRSRDTAYQTNVVKARERERLERARLAKEKSKESKSQRSKAQNYGDEASSENMRRFKQGKNTPKVQAAKALLQPDNKDWGRVIDYHAKEYHREKVRERKKEKIRQKEMRSILDQQCEEQRREKDDARQKAIQEGKELKEKARAMKEKEKELAHAQRNEFRRQIERRHEEEKRLAQLQRDRIRRRLAKEQREVMATQRYLEEEERRKQAKRASLQAENQQMLLEREKQIAIKSRERLEEAEKDIQLQHQYRDMLDKQDRQRAEAWNKMQEKQARYVAMGQRVFDMLLQAKKSQMLNEDIQIREHTQQAEKKERDRERKKREDREKLQRDLHQQMKEREDAWQAAVKERYEDGKRHIAGIQAANKRELEVQQKKRQTRIKNAEMIREQARQDYINKMKEQNGAAQMTDFERSFNRALLDKVNMSLNQ